MKAVIVNMTPAFLRELLQLPADAEIVDAKAEFGQSGVLQLKIYGAGYEVDPGQVLRAVAGTVTREGEALRISWPFAAE